MPLLGVSIGAGLGPAVANKEARLVTLGEEGRRFRRSVLVFRTFIMVC